VRESTKVAATRPAHSKLAVAAEAAGPKASVQVPGMQRPASEAAA